MNEVKTESINSRIDPKLCPTCPDLLAFVSGLDLWVTCISSGNECRLTHVHKGKSAAQLLICTPEYMQIIVSFLITLKTALKSVS